MTHPLLQRTAAIAGFALAAENAAGAVVDLRRRASRVPASLTRRLLRPLNTPSPQTLAAVVEVLRRVERNPLAGARLDPAVAMALLQQAAEVQKDVLIGYVDHAGVATQRVVRPLTVSSGQLLAWDSTQGRPREFAVHRVTSVMSADPG